MKKKLLAIMLVLVLALCCQSAFAVFAASSKSDLQSKYDSAEAITLTDYTRSTAAKVEDALYFANLVLKDDGAEDKEIEEAAERIQTAVDSLVERGDNAALVAAIETYSKRVESNYTETSWETFIYALRAAKFIVNSDDASQADLDEALASLEEAGEALSRNKNLMLGQIKELMEFDVGASTRYTPLSFAVYKEAYNAAKICYFDKNAGNDELREAFDALQSAIEGLTVMADTSALDEAIFRGEQKANGSYSEKSLNRLNVAVANAKALQADYGTTEEQIAQAVAAIDAAIEGLEGKSGGCKSVLTAPFAAAPVMLLFAAGLLVRRRNHEKN